MVITVADLYRQTRKAILETEDADTATFYARNLLCHVTGMSKEKLLADGQKYVDDPVLRAVQLRQEVADLDHQEREREFYDLKVIPTYVSVASKLHLPQ